MSQEFLKIEELEIRRFSGVQRPSQRLHITADMLSPGLTIVYGPNGSGKSTTARAVRSLLWPASCRETTVGLSGVFQCGERPLAIRLEGRVSSASAAGQTCPFPQLPASWKPYFISLQDLLIENDDDLAKAIQREMYGSIDLDQAVDGLGLSDSRAGFQKAFSGLLEARKHRRETAAVQRDLQDRAGELARLQTQVDEAASLHEKIRLYEELILLHEKERNLQVCRERMAQFENADILRNLQGDEAERFSERRKGLRETQREILQLENRISDAREKQAECALDPTRVPGDNQFVKLQDFAAAIQRLEDQEAEKLQALAEAAAREESARTFAGGQLVPETAKALTVADLEKTFPLSERWRTDNHQYEALRSALSAQENLLNEIEVAEDDVEAEQGMDCLLEWLGTPAGSASGTGTFYLIGLGIACLVALAALLTPWALLLLPVAFVPVMVGWFRRAADPQGQQSLRHRLSEKYAGLAGVPPVGQWDEKTVRRALRGLGKLLIQQKETLRLKQRLQWLRDQVHDAREKTTSSKKAFLESLSSLGVECSAVPEHGGRVVAVCLNWQNARTQVSGLQEGLKALKDAKESRLETCRELCAELGIGCPATAADIKSEAAELAGRTTRWRDLERTIIQWSERLKMLKQEVAGIEKDMRDLATQRCGIADPEVPETEDAIRALVAEVDAFRTAGQRLRKAEDSLAETRTLLNGLAGFDEDSLDLPAEQLPHLLEECRSRQAATLEQYKQMGDLEGALARHRQGHDLEMALAEEKEAEDTLRDIRDKALDEGVGLALVELVRDKAGQLSSAILKRGRRIFADVTAGHYELLVASPERELQLMARDTTTGDRKSLAQLSSGTRVQLLLAVRLAFLEEQEEGVVSPPLILDEILANSDDERTGAIMRFVSHVVTNGRQMVYLTAQDDELAKWERMLKQKKDIPWTVLSLPPGRPVPTTQSSISDLAERHIPSPGDLSYDAYGKLLDVPPFPLSGGTGAQDFHVFYILWNTRDLHAVMTAGCIRGGQLDLLLKTGGKDFLNLIGVENEATFRSGVTSRLGLLRQLQETFQVGRGLPVTPEVVLSADSPVSRLKSAPEVAELARRLQGNGQALVTALRNREVKGFQQKKVGEFNDWLEDSGYLDPRPPCREDDLVPRVIAESANTLASAGLAVDVARRVLGRALKHHGIYT